MWPFGHKCLLLGNKEIDIKKMLCDNSHQTGCSHTKINVRQELANMTHLQYMWPSLTELLSQGLLGEIK